MKKNNNCEKFEKFEKQCGKKLSEIIRDIEEGKINDDLFISFTGIYSLNNETISFNHIYPSLDVYYQIMTGFYTEVIRLEGNLNADAHVAKAHSMILFRVLGDRFYDYMIEIINNNLSMIEKEGIKNTSVSVKEFANDLKTFLKATSIFSDHCHKVMKTLEIMSEFKFEEDV